ncbi:hypothetical protein Mapa_001389 [Marchantia paleacea]|nr:hypothetical protein Mapa_001389 [Marchantia paleacea]
MLNNTERTAIEYKLHTTFIIYRMPQKRKTACNFIPKPKKVVARFPGREDSSSTSLKNAMKCGRSEAVTKVVSKKVYNCNNGRRANEHKIKNCPVWMMAEI